MFRNWRNGLNARGSAIELKHTHDTNGFLFANLSIFYSCHLTRIKRTHKNEENSQTNTFACKAYKWISRTIRRLSPIAPSNVLSIESNKNRHRFATCFLRHVLPFLFCFSLSHRSVHTRNALIFIHCFALVYLAPLCSTASVPLYLFRQFFIRLQFRVVVSAVRRGSFLSYSQLVLFCFVCLYSRLPVVVSRFSYKNFERLSSDHFSMFQRFCRKLDNCNENRNGLTTLCRSLNIFQKLSLKNRWQLWNSELPQIQSLPFSMMKLLNLMCSYDFAEVSEIKWQSMDFHQTWNKSTCMSRQYL